MATGEIEFILFTVKQTDESIYDVGVDLEAREFRIEETDLYGHILGEKIEGKLRRKKVKQFEEELQALDFASWPKNEEDTLPIHLKNASVLYGMGDEQYFTTGNSTEDLSKLHKLIETLIGTTFGSYEFY